MALINCPECGKQISDKANACPNCGYPISADSVPSVAATVENEIQSEKQETQGESQQEQKTIHQTADQKSSQISTPTESEPKKKNRKAILVTGVLVLVGIVVAVMFYTGILGGMAGKYKLESMTRAGVTKTADDMWHDMYMVLNSDGTGYIYAQTIEFTIRWTDSSMTLSGMEAHFERSGRTMTITIWGDTTLVFKRTTGNIPNPPVNNTKSQSGSDYTSQASLGSFGFSGKWDIDSAEMRGITFGKEALPALGLDSLTLDVTNGGMVTVSAVGESGSVQGVISGNKLSIKLDNNEYDLVIEGDKLVWDMGDAGKLFFTR